MLSDRPYMRDDYQREKTSFLIWFLSATIAGFVIQNVYTIWLQRPGFIQMFALSTVGLRHGYVWSLLTYPLLHQDVLHLLFVVLGVFFLGRELITNVGEKRMMWLTAAGALGAGLAWFAVNFNRDGLVLGSTSILLCYLSVFACLFPNREISFLVFFVLPVRTRPKYIVWVVLFVALMGFLFAELPNRPLGAALPYSGYLGAMLVGWLYYRFFHEGNWMILRRSRDIELPRWMKRDRKAPAAAPVATTANSTREDLRAEVDRILDKINSHGFGSLTPEEKRKLDSAKDLLSRR